MTQSGPLGGQARQLGLIGHPVGHSLSPAMHNAAFAHQKMNCHYAAYAVEPQALAQAVDGIRALGFLGMNVTIPHKEAVIPLLDEVGRTALQIGAVNTIVNRGGRLIGYNTDGLGFLNSLEEAGVRLPNLQVVVLGSGGAARAIALHLAWSRVARVVVSNRTAARAEALVKEIQTLAPDVPVTAVEARSPEERAALIDAGLVVNCTPLGMKGENAGATPVNEINLLPQKAVVYDTVYTPAETRLLKEARLRGLRTVGGLGMLVHQGACAWEYWFGRRGPVAVMAGAARAALEGEV
ncbi:MAG TPA: shikimate dehydrogenase [Symbiobacteriaceae bacterium]|nr:shikimate dehydrogenase [Symbiobacteriaceae bacterium]